MSKRRVRNCRLHLLQFWTALLCAAPLSFTGEARADGDYIVKSGRIGFSVGSNIPFLKVSGASSAITGGGQAMIADNTATIRNLHVEVDPKSFKTGISLRDRHLYERVFTASEGSLPRIILRAERFQAKLNPRSSKWEGDLQAQLTMRGVTRPVSFHASGEKRGDTAIVAADGVVTTSAFGVKPISYTGATVKDEVRVIVSNLVLSPEM
jgi:polyisoprenoid-binding protein YceI